MAAEIRDFKTYTHEFSYEFIETLTLYFQMVLTQMESLIDVLQEQSTQLQSMLIRLFDALCVLDKHIVALLKVCYCYIDPH